MKLVRAILVALTFAFSVNGQTPASPCEPPKRSDWVRDELKGHVKTIREFHTWFLPSKTTGRLEKKPRRLESETQYDANGDRDGGGEVFHVPGDMEVTSINYVCGSNGRPKELRFGAKDGSTYPRTTYAYDENNRRTEEIYYYQNGSIQGKAIYVYDTAGNLIEEVNTTHVHPEHFMPKRYDVYITTKRTFKYDAKGNQIEEKHFHADGSIYGTWSRSFDSSGRLIKETRLDKLGRLENQDFYEYHTDGKLLTEINFDNSCSTHAGDFCKGNISSGDGFFYYATKTKYYYDSQGNWIKQVHSDMEGKAKKPAWKLSKVVEREITYYSN